MCTTIGNIKTLNSLQKEKLKKYYKSGNNLLSYTDLTGYHAAKMDL